MAGEDADSFPVLPSIEVAFLGISVAVSAFQLVAALLHKPRFSLQTYILFTTFADACKYMLVFFLIDAYEGQWFPITLTLLLFSFHAFYQYCSILLFYVATYYKYLSAGDSMQMAPSLTGSSDPTKWVYRVFAALMATLFVLFMGTGLAVSYYAQDPNFTTLFLCWDAWNVATAVALLVGGSYYVRQVVWRMEELLFDPHTHTVVRKSRFVAYMMAVLLFISMLFSVVDMLSLPFSEDLEPVTGPYSYRNIIRIVVYNTLPVAAICYAFAVSDSSSKVFLVPFESSGPRTQSTLLHAPLASANYGSVSSGRRRGVVDYHQFEDAGAPVLYTASALDSPFATYADYPPAQDVLAAGGDGSPAGSATSINDTA